jgi:hypothetical protein
MNTTNSTDIKEIHNAEIESHINDIPPMNINNPINEHKGRLNINIFSQGVGRLGRLILAIDC